MSLRPITEETFDRELQRIILLAHDAGLPPIEYLRQANSIDVTNERSAYWTGEGQHLPVMDVCAHCGAKEGTIEAWVACPGSEVAKR